MTALRRRSSLDRGEWLFVQDPQRAWTLGRVERRGAPAPTAPREAPPPYRARHKATPANGRARRGGRVRAAHVDDVRVVGGDVVVEEDVVAVAAARDPEGFTGRRRLVVLGPPGVVVPDDRGAPRLLHQRDGGGFVEARAATVVVQRTRDADLTITCIERRATH